MRAALLALAALGAISCVGGGSTAPAGIPTVYSGSFGGELTFSTTVAGTSRTSVCVATRLFSGTMKVTLTQEKDGTLTGTGEPSGTETETGITVSPFCQSTFGTASFGWKSPVTGTPAAFRFSGSTAASGGTNNVTFTGTLSGGVIVGTMTVTEAFTQQNAAEPGGPGGTTTGGGSASFAVTLR